MGNGREPASNNLQNLYKTLIQFPCLPFIIKDRKSSQSFAGIAANYIVLAKRQNEMGKRHGKNISD